MVRMITQLLIGVMFVFGVMTLVPKGILFIRMGRKARGSLYIFFGMIAAAVAVLSFMYAYMVYQEL